MKKYTHLKTYENFEPKEEWEDGISSTVKTEIYGSRHSILEKMSINNGVKIISNKIIDTISKNPNKKIIITKIPSKYNIRMISLTPLESSKYNGSFLKGKTTINEDGSYNLHIVIDKNLPPGKLHNVIYHEVQHAIDYVIKHSKGVMEPNINYNKLMTASSSNGYPNLKKMLYYSYDTEIKSKLHEVYINFKNYLDSENIETPTSNDVKKWIKNINNEQFWASHKYMINYNIMDDIMNSYNNSNNVMYIHRKISKNNLIDAAEYVNRSLKNKIILDPFDRVYVKNRLKKIESFIHKQGEKLRTKSFKILQMIIDEYNN